MRVIPTGVHWAAVAASCAIVTVLTSHPGTLPDPCRRGIERAVDEVARGLLRLWDEPADALEHPAEEWVASPIGNLSWLAGPDGDPAGASAVRG